MVGLNAAWQLFIAAINGNNPAIFAKIADAGWGPSKGISNGKLWLICLVYWMQIVNVLEIVVGVDGRLWGRCQSLGLNNPVPDPSIINYQNTPWLVQHVTFQNNRDQQVDTGVFVTDNVYVPIISAVENQFFLPMEVLEKL